MKIFNQKEQIKDVVNGNTNEQNRVRTELESRARDELNFSENLKNSERTKIFY